MISQRILLTPAILFSLCVAAHPQSFGPTPAFPLTQTGLVISRPVQLPQPFTVAGEHGVIVGTQDGSFESWIFPIKLLSHLTIEANLEGYTVPIPVNPQSANIEVRPDHTTITYSHPGFTLRQIMFSPNSCQSRSEGAGGLTPLKQSGEPTRALALEGCSSSSLNPHTGPIVLFQIDAIRPLDLTFRFTPEMRWMWPKRNEGIPSPEWVPAKPQATGEAEPAQPTGEGFYILHLDYGDLAGAIAIPTATPGILAPYQERPQVHPLELHLHYDPKRDGTGLQAKYFPLLMAVATTPQAATAAALRQALDQLNAGIPAAYQAHAALYAKLQSESTSIETPDKSLNESFQWGVVSIEQLKAKVPQVEDLGSSMKGTGFSPYISSNGKEGASAPEGNISAASSETALVAGYYASADSARPGFGWFFGRDALYTLYAVNNFGDFALTRSELEFLVSRQRPDGKIMHEYSQTASDPSVDWKSFPYMYAAADATPLFLMAMRDYLRASGDTAFIQSHKEAIEKAWAFETAPTSDTDHDGIYDNSQGTGWVESWPNNAMPHQEVYLALLDEQASLAYAELAQQIASLESAAGMSAPAKAAKARAAKIAATIEQEYYDPQKGCYAFSHNLPNDPNGETDKATTVYPAIAWWDSNPSAAEISPEGAGAFRPLNKSGEKMEALAPERRPASPDSPLAHPEACLQQFAAPTLDTDWGLRDVATTEPFYDGLSYHQGSVWPLFTGWAALAEYRANQPVAGEQMLMQNVDLTWAQDPGSVTELLSGDYFVPFGRSTSHQLWSSAMVITPALRGLFGITLDAATNTITVDPHLPAEWDHAKVENLHLGTSEVDLDFSREEGHLKVMAQVKNDSKTSTKNSTALTIRSDVAGAKFAADKFNAGWLTIPLPAVEISAPRLVLQMKVKPTEPDVKSARDPLLGEFPTAINHQLPAPGSRTSQVKVLSVKYAPHRMIVTASAPAETYAGFVIRHNEAMVPRIDYVQKKEHPEASVGIGLIGSALIKTDQPFFLTAHFPSGQGYQTLEFTLTW
jgi:glycogen debranching enzyme